MYKVNVPGDIINWCGPTKKESIKWYWRYVILKFKKTHNATSNFAKYDKLLDYFY